MNRYQFVYLVTIVGVLSTLIVISNVLKAKLREAGYDISELILIGLPKENVAQKVENKSPLAAFMSSELAKNVPQVLALVLAVVTSALVYWKFGSSELRGFPMIDST